jgi:predicted permease
MSTAGLILPDFAVILAGLVLRRLAGFGSELWAGVERLTYFVLFPAVLFYANARARLDLGTAAPLLGVVLATLVAGMALGLAGRALLRPSDTAFGAGFQCAFRFNTYIGLALASRLSGEQGLALMALVVGVAVPLVNVAAVWGLARGRNASIVREIALNPLVLASLSGVAYGASGLPLPELVGATLSRLGAAAIVLGLLAVGAALSAVPARENAGWVGWIVAVKLLALPAVAWLLGRWIALPRDSFATAVLFAALPAASSAYILAVRLGGDARIAAQLVSYSTAASLVSLPFWIEALR